MKPYTRIRHGICLGLVGVFFSACTPNNPRDRFILAEKLFLKGDHEQAATEFERVIQREPKSTLGVQALYRLATLQTLYLKRHLEAAQNLKRYIQLISPLDAEKTWEAQKELGEIYFDRIEFYSEAVAHYQKMLEQRPQDKEASFYLYRIGRAQFFLWRFKEAYRTFSELTQKYPESPWCDDAAYQRAVVWYTRGERASVEELSEQEEGKSGKTKKKQPLEPNTKAYTRAMELFREFIEKYPTSALVVEARFGIASSLEEMGQLAEALAEFEKIQNQYPSQNVIKIKIHRLKERIIQSTR